MFDSLESIWKPLWEEYPGCLVDHQCERWFNNDTGWRHTYTVRTLEGRQMARQVWLETAAGVWTREN